ncbi:hypothetical protein N9Y48_04465 [Zobellia sp.]|nr:hypothetical protein [Zobellia sp.]
MQNKTIKFITKTLILFPLGFGFFTLINGFENFYWFFSTVLGFMFAFGIVFWNVFDYEKYDAMEIADFLESSHELNVENSDKNWNLICDMMDQSIVQLKKIKKTPSALKAEIPRKFLASVFTAEKEESGILLRIKKKGLLKFLPDNTENYRTLRKFQKQLNR